jgi:hypothetical protein
MLEEELTAALRPLVQGHVTNALDQLVHPQRRPQGDHHTDIPAIVYQVISEEFAEYSDLCGYQLCRKRVQVDCYHRTYKEARKLAYEANLAMTQIGLPGEPERGGTLLTITPFPDDTEKAHRWLVEHYFWRTASEVEEELGIA